MSEGIKGLFILRNAEIAQQAWEFVRANAKTCAEVGRPLVLRITEEEPTRTVLQNAKIHAMCRDFSQQVEWAGKPRSTEDWKRLLVDAFDRVKESMGEGHHGDIVPSLDGSGVVIPNRLTREFKVREGAEFIEYMLAYGAEKNVVWTEPKKAVAKPK